VADAMIYAERTGHANFEETDEAIPPMSEAERKERLEKVKQLIKDKTAAREEDERKEAQERERKRRQGGQEMGRIREEQEAAQRKRDAEARDREKQRFKDEQRKLHEEVARDKAERAMEKARRLGTGDPKKAYDEAYAKALGQHETAPEEKADAAIEVLASYRTGGRGAECVRTLLKMLSNVANNPAEPKFRKVNLTNETFKAKVSSLQGGLALLKAAGFTEEGESLVLGEAADMARVSVVVDKLAKAQPRFS
jgi:hypothetical protein